LERCLSSLVVFILFFSTFLEAITFKVASYNLENLFDLKYNGGEYSEYIPNSHNWNRKTLKIKLKNLSEVICEVDADIIALQEVENLNSLKLLKKTLNYYGCYYKYFAITSKPTSSTQVAILSRFKIEYSKDIRVPKKGLRDILEVKFIIDNYPFYIFINHWKSKRGKKDISLLSAKTLKKRLKNFRGEEYILIGDFNSNYNEYRLSNILNVSNRVCNLNRNGHYNLWYELPIYQRWSYNFYGKKQGLDNILISPSLLDGKRIDYIRGSFNRFKAKYLFHKKKGYILRWVYKKGKHKGVGYSDHLPIYAKFSTKPFIYPNCLISDGDIKTLKSKELRLPIRLKAKVIEVSKNSAYIADSSGKIKIFGLDRELRVGESYTFIIYKTTIYKGEFEVVDFNIEKG